MLKEKAKQRHQALNTHSGVEKSEKKGLKRPVLLGLLLSLLMLLLLEVFNYTVGNRAILSYIDKVVQPLAEPEQSVTVSVDPIDGYTVLTAKEDREIRVLQLTDLHLTAGFPTYYLDVAAVNAVYRLVKEAKPDLIVLTGDSVSPIIYSGATGNSSIIAEAVGLLFERIGIPWTLVYGNHDREGFMSLSEMSAYFESLPNCLFRRGPVDIDGYGNHIIKLKNVNGDLQNILFFFDTNSGGMGSYDNVHTNQIAWYRSEVDRLKALHGDFSSAVYIHVPPEEMKHFRTRLEMGDTSLTLLYGAYNESVASGTNHGLYEALAEKGVTKYLFFGHDHTNSAGVYDEATGITLSYSLSIDYSAYPLTRFTSYQRGGNILTLASDGSMALKQLYIDHIP